MLRFKDVYAVPAEVAQLGVVPIKGNWFPEIRDLGDWLPDELTEVLTAEGRFTVRQLVDVDCRDGDRYAIMCTIWFDGNPVAIIQQAGRGGRDHFQRWITDGPRYLELCGYLLSKLTVQELFGDDEVDPEKLIYPEEVFSFYGDYHGEKFGYPREPKTRGFQIFPTSDRLIPDVDKNFILVTAKASVTVMPQYLRRNEYVMELVRAVTHEELTRNPNILPCSEDSGYTQHYFYKHVERPAEGTVVSV